MNIAAYCRVSTDKDDQLNSLETQKSFFMDYAKKTGQTLVRLYADAGLSGTKTKIRKEFLQLLSDAELGLFDQVVVKDISRFARNTVDLLQSIRKLKALGIETTFLTANMSVLGQSEFVLTIFGALAQEESANISKRVKFGKKENAKKGRVPNLVYGYDKIRGDYFNLEINAQEAAVVRQIYDWYTKDGNGSAKIAKMLNARGLRTKRNCAWSQSAACRILTNELYTGKIINGKEEVSDFLTSAREKKDEANWLITDRPDLRIITQEQFNLAQSLMKERSQAFLSNKGRHSNRHLFSTLIKCKECGRSFRRTVRKYKNTYVRWCCSGHNGNGALCCPNAVTVDESELVGAIGAYFASVLSAHTSLKQLESDFLRAYKENLEIKGSEKELKHKKNRLLKTRRKNIEMYTHDLISLDELSINISGVQSELDRLDNALDALRGDIAHGEQLGHRFKEVFSSIQDFAQVDRMSNSLLRKILYIEVDKIGNVDVHIHKLSAQQPKAVCR